MNKAISLLLCAGLLNACQKVKNNPDVFALEGELDTLRYEQADFHWHVSPRHDYSKTLVGKLFLCQAEYDKEYLGQYKMRDNGQQTVYMTIAQALEAIKVMDELTLGLPKIMYLVGWQYLGHDSKYPAFFEGNESLKRPEDENALQSLRWLMDEARKYHTAVSLHINLFDAFTDSPLYEKYVREDVLARTKEGELIHGDWGYKVSYAAEWEKGLVQQRLDSLCSLLPVQEAGTIHIDAFHNSVPRPYAKEDGGTELHFESPISPWHGHTAKQDQEAKANIVQYLDQKGIDVTTEGVGGMGIGGIEDGYFPMYWHFNDLNRLMHLRADQACGGNVYGDACVFGMNLNVEQLFRDHPDFSDAAEHFKGNFCRTTLITQFLNRHGRQMIVRNDKGQAIGVLDDGIRTLLKDGRLNVAQGGTILCDEEVVLVPAPWVSEKALVAFSEKGITDRTWILPRQLRPDPNAQAWTVTPQGRQPYDGFHLRGQELTLTLAPGQMVIIN
ncbi:MAG: hypothetical protein IJR87_08905 [Bacteroidaceae bacterium]|nr:hypothetical protein [Bacteroidaceae bacterium]